MDITFSRGLEALVHMVTPSKHKSQSTSISNNENRPNAAMDSDPELDAALLSISDDQVQLPQNILNRPARNRRAPTKLLQDNVTESKKPGGKASTSKTIFTCSSCVKEVKKVINCGRCEECFCLECMAFTESDYKSAIKRPNIVSYCNNCLDKSLKVVHGDYDVEQRCESFVKEVSDRITAIESSLKTKVNKDYLESALESKVNTNDLEKEVHKSVSAVLSSKITETIRSEITAASKETRLREQKKLNLMVFNVPETQDDEGNDHDMQADKVYFENLCKDELDTQVQVTSTSRIGSKNGERARPLIVKMAEVRQKGLILKKAKTLDSKKNQVIKNIYIKPDLTPTQRQESLELRKLRDQKREESEAKGEVDMEWVIRKGKLIQIPIRLATQNQEVEDA